MARGDMALLGKRIIGSRFQYTNASNYSNRFQAFFSDDASAIIKKKTINAGCRDDPKLPYFSTSRKQRRSYSRLQPESPPPPNSNGKIWTAGGIFMTGILPLSVHKYMQYLEDIDNVVETAEEIVDVIEVVAQKVDELAEDIGEDLPEGGKLKNTVALVEDVAEAIAKDAHLAGEFIDKVGDIDEKLEAIVKRRHIKEGDNNKLLK